MKKRLIFALLVAVAAFAILYSSWVPLGAADQPAPAKKIGDFTLKDINHHDVSLSTFKDKKVVVVVFVGTECPINNQYMARLAELQKTYAEQGVQFLAINANREPKNSIFPLSGRLNLRVFGLYLS